MKWTLKLLLLFVAGLFACGGNQAAIEATPEQQLEDEPCCLDDRWEEPPPRVGQTPPEQPADSDALDDFEPEGSSE